MTAGPRDYATGTRAALFLLSQGTCYEPTCTRPVVTWIDEATPAVDAQIAHIYGANPGSPRYVDAMSDDERRAFPNLILLCKPHHDLVDKIRPDDHRADLLKQWKANREGGDGAALQAVTEDVLEQMIIEAVRQAGPTRKVEVELMGGFVYNGVEAAVLPIDGWQVLLDLNPHTADFDRVLVTTVRNVGALRASVVGVDVQVGMRAGKKVMPFAYKGRNDFAFLNPSLPRALESGDQMNWLTALTTVQSVRDAVDATNSAIQPVEVWSEVRLGSGERLGTERHALALLPLPPRPKP